MDTERLIRTLAEDAAPVRPLDRPWRRAAVWTIAGAGYLLVLVLMMSPRTDLGARIQDPRFLFEQAAALIMAVTAALAAFVTVVPGHRHHIIWLPIVAAATWLAIIGVGAWRDASLAPTGSALLQADWACVWTVLIGAAVPAVVMARMLRRGAPLTPHVSAALGGLAAAGLGNLGICLFHPHSSNVTVLVWHGGVVVMFAVLVGIAGGQLLRWPSRLRAVRPL
jgi:hypothetical protein